MIFFFPFGSFPLFFQEGFDQSFIEEAIFGRLRDDNRDVVMSALSSLEVSLYLDMLGEILAGLEYVSGMYSLSFFYSCPWCTAFVL